MRVVEPISVTDAVLDASTGSNIPEDDHAEWSSGTAYVVGDRVILASTHRIYEALVDNTGVDPATDIGTTWLNIGATNRWKAFDKLISDPVTKAGDIVYTLVPGTIADAIAFFGLNASSIRVVCTDPTDGVIYDVTRQIVDNSIVFDGFSYVFEPVIYETQEIFTGLPIYTGVEVEITISSGGTTAVGQIVLGRDQVLGTTMPGTGIGIEDFSRKERDIFGNAVLVERPFAQTTDFQFTFPTDGARRVAGILARLRAKPAVYYAGDGTSMFGTTIYGFYRDFSIPLTTTISFGTLEIEGLT
ncbi:hypothetical protein [Jannaschia formosa]|uniref:hypothetical protein n=1 Tax=Jannaschia formosa TaxID=2259592 RepID=UPI000E1BBA42|nr:hypothetical protein [Jannaschia formosa]TFL16442.1 hypothetical protein DR046_20185 [Jannaschia formosa]